jgi:hypothetical protein
MIWYATLVHFHLWMKAYTSDENDATGRAELLRFNGAVERDPAIEAWMNQHTGELGTIRASDLSWCENAGTKSGSSCMTAFVSGRMSERCTHRL